MTSATRYFAAFAALALAVATGLGAWASHGLGAILSAAALRSVETAIDYQFFHSLGLLALAAIQKFRNASATLLASQCAIAVGTVLFCGGVYASSFDGPAIIASAAPVGGVVLILGWLAAAIGLLTSDKADA